MVLFGAIRPYKGVDILLRAVAELSDWPRDLKLLIAGHMMAGISEEDLYGLRDELGIQERIILKLEYFPEVVNSDIGFLAEDSSVPSLTKALAQALRHRHSWVDMGTEALKRARLHYSWNNIAKKTLRFYEELEKH